MTKVLITGATGNVGVETVKALLNMDHHLDLYAGVRDLKGDNISLSTNGIKCLHFDFLDIQTYKHALLGCDVLFLLRPPQISAVDKYFKPLINACVEEGVGHIVFLSVQGVEKSNIIPHHKIEKLIRASNIVYTFLRPAYFMQNLTTTLRVDLVTHSRIYLPAGQAKFVLIDVRDIGAVAANILTNISQHTNKSYELTGNEKLTFFEMANRIGTQLGIPMRFESPNLLQFFIAKRREHVPVGLILVMIMLHYLPGFQKEPELTDWVKKITNKDPITFDQFINDNRLLLLPKMDKEL